MRITSLYFNLAYYLHAYIDFGVHMMHDGKDSCCGVDAYHKARSTLSGAAQNGQCMTLKYRESDKRADGCYAFEWLSRYFDDIHWPFYTAPFKVERACMHAKTTIIYTLNTCVWYAGQSPFLRISSNIFCVYFAYYLYAFVFIVRSVAFAFISSFSFA